MNICYSRERKITSDQFIEVLKASTLAARRPVNDPDCIDAMLRHANLLCTAWDGDHLVGVARSVTDFAYCCYLSDLAVVTNYQGHGIGKRLLKETASGLSPTAKIILLSAPAAVGFYGHAGLEPHPSAWTYSASSFSHETAP